MPKLDYFIPILVGNPPNIILIPQFSEDEADIAKKSIKKLYKFYRQGK